MQQIRDLRLECTTALKSLKIFLKSWESYWCEKIDKFHVDQRLECTTLLKSWESRKLLKTGSLVSWSKSNWAKLLLDAQMISKWSHWFSKGSLLVLSPFQCLCTSDSGVGTLFSGRAAQARVSSATVCNLWYPTSPRITPSPPPPTPPWWPGILAHLCSQKPNSTPTGNSSPREHWCIFGSGNDLTQCPL